jgi:maleate cis-trans isomerase
VLIDEGAKAIVVLGVPVAARRGFAADSAALKALTADRGAVPIISSLAASVLALQHVGVKRPLVVTQYNDEVNAAIAAYCRDAGLAVAGIAGLGASNAAMVNALSVSDYASLTKRALDQNPQVDGLFLSARGSLLSLTQTLETTLGLPAIEQAQATVWWSLSRLGVVPSSGESRLLRPDHAA